MNMLTKPSDWYLHCQNAVASTIMAVIYGKPPVKAKSEATIEKFHDFIHQLTRAALPGANLVEIFTWMRHLPRRLLHPLCFCRWWLTYCAAFPLGRSEQRCSMTSTRKCLEAYSKILARP